MTAVTQDLASLRAWVDVHPDREMIRRWSELELSGASDLVQANERRPGLPPIELRRVHRLWTDSEGDEIQFSFDGTLFDWTAVHGRRFGYEDWHYVENMVSTSFNPLGATWAEVEAKAKAVP